MMRVFPLSCLCTHILELKWISGDLKSKKSINFVSTCGFQSSENQLNSIIRIKVLNCFFFFQKNRFFVCLFVCYQLVFEIRTNPYALISVSTKCLICNSILAGLKQVPFLERFSFGKQEFPINSYRFCIDFYFSRTLDLVRLALLIQRVLLLRDEAAVKLAEPILVQTTISLNLVLILMF